MLKQFLGAVWRYLPPRVRYRLARIGQKRFTVTTAAIIFDEDKRVLLLEHVFRPDSGWGVPGGFVSKGEHPEEGLRREMREEIGVELSDVNLLLARGLGKIRQIEIYYRAKVIGTPKARSFEIKRAEWFALDELPPELAKDQRRLIERALIAHEKS